MSISALLLPLASATSSSAFSSVRCGASWTNPISMLLANTHFRSSEPMRPAPLSPEISVFAARFVVATANAALAPATRHLEAIKPPMGERAR